MGLINLTVNKMPAKVKTSKTPKVGAKKAAKGGKQKNFSKTYKQMIKDILTSIEDRKGLSGPAIKTHIKDVFHNEVVPKAFNKSLKALVADNEVTQKKGHYKMTKDQKADKEKIAKKKAAAVKAKARKDAKKAKDKIKKQIKRKQSKKLPQKRNNQDLRLKNRQINLQKLKLQRNQQIRNLLKRLLKRMLESQQ